MADDTENNQTDETDEQETGEQDETQPAEAQSSGSSGVPHWLWGQKPWDAFKTFAILFSFALNLTLVIILLAVAGLIIPIVNDIVEPIVSGLNDSFVEMSEATIEQEITIDTTMPISFTLPLEQSTVVILTEDVPLTVPAHFLLPGGGGEINGVVTIIMPAGLPLPVAMSMEVPVNQTIPVSMKVPVEIPLAETELGGPFFKLRALFGPLNDMLKNLPSSNEEVGERVKQVIIEPPAEE